MVLITDDDDWDDGWNVKPHNRYHHKEIESVFQLALAGKLDQKKSALQAFKAVIPGTFKGFYLSKKGEEPEKKYFIGGWNAVNYMLPLINSAPASTVGLNEIKKIKAFIFTAGKPRKPEPPEPTEPTI